MAATLNETELTKGELRKLGALRKSLGSEIADEAFVKWKSSQANGNDAAADPNVAMIEDALLPLLDKLRMPRGGAYAVRRGRGRFIIEPIELS